MQITIATHDIITVVLPIKLNTLAVSNAELMADLCVQSTGYQLGIWINLRITKSLTVALIRSSFS